MTVTERNAETYDSLRNGLFVSDEILKMKPNRLACVGSSLFNRRAVGNAAGQHGHEDRVPAFRFGNEIDLVGVNFFRLGHDSIVLVRPELARGRI